MKKRLLLLSMVAISTLTLTGCNVTQLYDKKTNEQIIVKLGNGDSYTADDLFAKYSSTSAGASEYFSAVYDVLVSDVQPKTSKIINDVDSQLTTFVNNCKEAATSNGTLYSTELSNALEKAGVEDLGELEQVYLLDAQKTAFEDSYYDGMKWLSDTSENAVYRDGALQSLLKEYINYYAPYHVRHILVKLSADDSLYDGKISEDDAKHLYNVVSRLAKGDETFGNIARTTASTGDTGSATNYGNLGIMDLNTSYVSEFKYSVYQYDALYNTDAKDGINAYNARQASRKLGEGGDYETSFSGTDLIPAEYAEQVKQQGINRIPYELFVQLNKYSKTTLNKDETEYENGKEKYFPRNVLYNHYLNDHRLGAIVRGDNADVASSTRFKHIEGLSATAAAADDVLVDETGRPILVSKAGTGGDSGYQGIHFIINQKSPFVKEADSTHGATLEEQLLYYYDISTIYNTSDSGNDLPNDKYVTFLNTTRDQYLNTIKSLKSSLKGFDSYMNYRMFEAALKLSVEKHGEVTFGSVTMKDNTKVQVSDLIKSYITSNRANSIYNANESYNKSWESYVNLIEAQNELEQMEVPMSIITDQFDGAFDPANIK